VSLEAGGGIPCRPNPAATLLVAVVLTVIVVVAVRAATMSYSYHRDRRRRRRRRVPCSGKFYIVWINIFIEI